MLYAFMDNNDGYYQVDVPVGESLPEWTLELIPTQVIIPEPAPVLYICSPWQIRKALNQLNLRSTVESVITSSPQDVKDGWDFATEFRNDDPLVIQLGQMLGKTQEELNSIFELAITL